MTNSITKTERSILKAYALDKGDAYRITKDGDLHIKGKMRNTNQYGWYLEGFYGDVLKDIKRYG